MKNLLLMFAIIMESISMSAQDFPYTDWQQKLIDNMFDYEGLYYSVLSDEAKTAVVFDPVIFQFDSGGYKGQITVAENPIKDGVEYTTVGIAPQCFISSSITSLALPNSILSISEAISSLHQLENLVISENVESIVSSFLNLTCPSFEEYTIPESVKELVNSFGNIDSLKKITLPSHPLLLTDAFYGLPLEKIVCSSIEPYPLSDYTFDGIDKSICVVEVPAGCVKAYREAAGWREFVNIIESDQNTVKAIGNSTNAHGKAYHIDGTEFNDTDRGLYILNGRKFIKP